MQYYVGNIGVCTRLGNVYIIRLLVRKEFELDQGKDSGKSSLPAMLCFKLHFTENYFNLLYSHVYVIDAE